MSHKVNFEDDPKVLTCEYCGETHTIDGQLTHQEIEDVMDLFELRHRKCKSETFEIEVDDMFMANYMLMMQTGDVEDYEGKPHRVCGVAYSCATEKCTITLEPLK
jgi:hypothetical protein